MHDVVARVSYDDELDRGDRLMAVNVAGAEHYLTAGDVYHFSRWANQSTLLLLEIESNVIGKVGFDPARFVRV